MVRCLSYQPKSENTKTKFDGNSAPQGYIEIITGFVKSMSCDQHLVEGLQGSVTILEAGFRSQIEFALLHYSF